MTVSEDSIHLRGLDPDEVTLWMQDTWPRVTTINGLDIEDLVTEWELCCNGCHVGDAQWVGMCTTCWRRTCATFATDT